MSSRDDIEILIRNFYKNPNINDYYTIKNWYGIRSSQPDPTNFIFYVYIFLLGANMKNRYESYDEDVHRSYITKVRDWTQGSDPESLIRKGYFDFGLGVKKLH